MKRYTILTVAAVLFAMIAALNVFGQVTTSSLTVEVNDSSGAVVGGAAITLRNTATGEQRTATSNSEGTFVFELLPPATYSVTVEAKGFKKAVAPNIEVNVSKPARATIALEVGELSQTVTVTAAQDIINTSSPTLTNVIDPRQVRDLPLPTRNPLDLAGLQPGVAVTGTDNRGSSISGLRQTAVNLTQDGINAMDNFVKTSSLFAISSPSLNSTSEFSITTGTNSSDAGRGVAQIRLVTRGGSNDFHGEGFYLVRSDSLESNLFFNNLNGVPKGIEHQHFFGFSMGGHMWAPRFGEGGKRLYNLRDKAFWFFSYEGFREHFQVTRNRLVLTAAARTGLFSYTNSAGATQTVNLLSIGAVNTLNPVTGAQLAVIPLPNNTLVGDGLNTAGFTYNVTGSDPNNKYVFRYDHQLVEKSKLGSHKLEVVWNRAIFTLFPDTFNGIEAPFPGGIDAGQASTRNLLTFADHSTFGKVTNEFRYGRQWAPVQFLRAAPPAGPFFINFSGVNSNSAITNFDNTFMSQGRNTIPMQIIDNLAWPKGKHTFRFGTDYQQIFARSFNDAGIEETINIGTNGSNSNGIVASKFPNLPSGTTGTAIVNRAIDVFNDVTGFLGSANQTFNVTSPSSGFVPGATRLRLFRERDFAAYAQDQWHFRRNLTLNLGLRWEFLGVPTIPDGVAINPTNAQDIFGITGGIGNLFQPTAPAGAAPAQATLNFVSGTTGKGLYKNDLNNFAPYFGFAWSPAFKSGFMHKIFGDEGTSSFRGGYSISYLHDGFTTISNALGVGTTNPGLIQTAANTTPTGVLASSGIALTTPTFVMPITDRQNNLVNPNNGLWAFDPNLRIPYVQQWSFGYEREFKHNMAFEIRYVGNHAIKVWRAVDFNEVNIFENGFLPEFLNAQKNLTANGGASFASGCSGCVALPILTKFFTGLAASSGFANATFISNLTNNNVGTMASTLAFSNTYRTNRENAALGIPANFFVANPNAAFARLLTNDSFSNYNALELEVRRRFSGGLQFQADYTWSKTFDLARDAQGNNQSDLVSFRTLRNKRLDYTLANQDQRHRFVANAIYDLPFGNGKRFLSGVHGMANRLLGGWSVGSIVVWQTSPPFYITSGRSTFNSFNAGNNPVDLVGISFQDFKNNLGVFKTPTGVYFVNPNLLNITTNAAGQFVSSTLKPGLMAAPAPGFFGNFPINSLRGPSYFNWDASVVKRLPITERVKLEMKTTFINALNHANFTFPGNTANGVVNTLVFDSSTFGRVTAQRGGDGSHARIIHFTFKITW